MPFEDATFDAAFSVEATVHSPDVCAFFGCRWLMVL